MKEAFFQLLRVCKSHVRTPVQPSETLIPPMCWGML